MEYKYKIVVTFESGQSTTIDQDEIDSMDINLEYGYDVDGFINEALLARHNLTVPA